MPAKAGIQAGRLRGCLVDSRFRGNDEFGTQLSSWAKPGGLVEEWACHRRACVAEGLPAEASYDLVYRHALVVDRDGTRLAIGSTTGNLWISDSGGERWEQLAGHLPPIAQVAFG